LPFGLERESVNIVDPRLYIFRHVLGGFNTFVKTLFYSFVIARDLKKFIKKLYCNNKLIVKYQKN